MPRRGAMLPLLAWAQGAAASAPFVELNESTFDAFLAAQPQSVVQFYAPWCLPSKRPSSGRVQGGNCARLEPAWAAAAQALGAEGVAFGRVTYGNVGSQERLDFTVIGQPANIAARLGDYGKGVNERIVVTEDIAGATPDARPLGPLRLHNVSRPVVSFAVGSGEALPLPPVLALPEIPADQMRG